MEQPLPVPKDMFPTFEGHGRITGLLLYLAYALVSLIGTIFLVVRDIIRKILF